MLGRTKKSGYQDVDAEISIKLLQFGKSSSFLGSTRLGREGNDSIIWLWRLPPVGVGLDCGDWGTRESEERSSASLFPLDKIASTDISLAVIVDDLLSASRSAEMRGEETKDSSSSSSSLILMKFNWAFLGILPEDSRPSRQARATERFIRLVSELTEKEADVAETDIVVLWVGFRSKVGESGSDGSLGRNDWSAMDNRGKEARGEMGLSAVDLKTPLRMWAGPGFSVGMGVPEAEILWRPRECQAKGGSVGLTGDVRVSASSRNE
jgi:hypothetical protein